LVHRGCGEGLASACPAEGDREAAIPGHGPGTFDISGALPAVAEVDEDETMQPTIAIASTTGADEGGGPTLPQDDEINENDLVIIHTGLRLDKTSTVKLMRDRLLSYPAPIWGSKQVLWARVVQYEKELARQRRTKRFIQEREEAMNLDPSSCGSRLLCLVSLRLRTRSVRGTSFSTSRSLLGARCACGRRAAARRIRTFWHRWTTVRRLWCAWTLARCARKVRPRA
jgi:hypothetical protein